MSSSGQAAAPGSDLQCRLAVFQGLVKVSSLINSITDYGAMLEAVISVSRDVFQCEAASLFLPTSAGMHLQLAVAAKEGTIEKPGLLVPKGEGIAWWVYENQQAQLIPNAYEDSRFYREGDRSTGFATRSILSAPLVHDGRTVAVLQLFNPLGKESFDQADLEAIHGYSSLLATALEKMRVLEERQRAQLLSRDLEIAAEIQRGELARAMDDSLAGHAFVYIRPAFEVGGDFYFVRKRQNGDVWFAVGDVSGKGIAAAMLMTQTMGALRFLVRGAAGPAAVLARINRVVCEVSVRGMFVTMLLGRFQENGMLQIASAGHCHPWLAQPDGRSHEWHIRTGLPLGILEDTVYYQAEREWKDGELFLAFSDGLSESRSAADSQLFADKLSAVLQNAPKNAEALGTRLIEAESEHRGSAPQRDDLTVLVLERP